MAGMKGSTHILSSHRCGGANERHETLHGGEQEKASAVTSGSAGARKCVSEALASESASVWSIDAKEAARLSADLVAAVITARFRRQDLVEPALEVLQERNVVDMRQLVVEAERGPHVVESVPRVGIEQRSLG